VDTNDAITTTVCGAFVKEYEREKQGEKENNAGNAGSDT
jgi:hypothetical protein